MYVDVCVYIYIYIFIYVHMIYIYRERERNIDISLTPRGSPRPPADGPARQRAVDARRLRAILFIYLYMIICLIYDIYRYIIYVLMYLFIRRLRAICLRAPTSHRLSAHMQPLQPSGCMASVSEFIYIYIYNNVASGRGLGSPWFALRRGTSGSRTDLEGAKGVLLLLLLLLLVLLLLVLPFLLFIIIIIIIV